MSPLTPDDDRFAALAYPLGFVSGLFCLYRWRDQPFIRFHAWQSIIASALVVVGILVFDRIPLLGIGLVFFLTLGAVLSIPLLVWQAYRGRWFVLPLVGDIALERARSAEP